MSAMNGGDVGIAVAEMVRVLSPHGSADWTVPAGSLEWTCRATAEHVAHDLLHTYDITRGLDVPWSPPPALCRQVLDRLFPDAPAGDPVTVLLWSTGRAGLADRPRRTSWVWNAAVPDPGGDSPS